MTRPLFDRYPALAVLDDETLAHLQAWLATQWEADREKLTEKINASLADAPDRIEDWSWPELAGRWS